MPSIKLLAMWYYVTGFEIIELCTFNLSTICLGAIGFYKTKSLQGYAHIKKYCCILLQIGKVATYHICKLEV